MGSMQSPHERVAQALMGVVGLVAGMLSALALAIVAVLGPVLGLLAVLAWPVRAIIERLRRASRPAPPVGS
jgi:hypothetical protein